MALISPIFQVTSRSEKPPKCCASLTSAYTSTSARDVCQPGASGTSWRAYRSRGMLFLTDIFVPVCPGQDEQLLEKLKAIQKSDRHIFPGTVARYVVKADEMLTRVQILLVWKSTEMPNETKRAEDLALFQAELADVLDWEAAQWSTNEVIIHT